MDDNKKTGPRDVFSQLLAILFLYTSIISFGTLLFQYINIYFPDPLSFDYGGSLRESIRVPLSILIIIFPLYVWLTAYLQRDLIRNPEKRVLKTRRWLLYFTLFLATIVIAVDLVTLVYWLLSGELTPRFLLKVATVLVMAVSVFVYYLWNLRHDEPALKHPTMRIFVYVVLGLSAVAIVAGFFIAGSPFQERLRRFDDQRVQNLQNIQWEITNYWQAKRHLPANLDELANDISGFRAPLDPETGQPYEYRVTSDTSFELCSNFNLESDNQTGMSAVPIGMTNDVWSHAAGKKCFTRTIDPDRLPPFLKQ